MRVKYRKQNSELMRLTGELYGEVQTYEEDGRGYFIYSFQESSKILKTLNGFCRSWKDIYYHKDDICSYISNSIGGDVDIVFSNNNANRYNGSWKKIRRQVVDRDCGKCVNCGSIDYLTVHHIDCNSKNDLLTNLKTLCWECHAEEHPHMQKTPPKNWKKW